MKTNNRFLICTAAMIGIVVLPFMWGSAVSAQGPTAYIRVVRAIKTSKLEIQHPAGLAFSTKEEVFHVVESIGESQQLPIESDLILITPQPVQATRTRIPAGIVNPVNMTFDNARDCVLILLPNANVLIQVGTGRDGSPNSNSLTHFNARSFDLQDPRGMAIDPASGALVILDSAGPGIVRVARGPDGGFDGAEVSRMDLPQLSSVVLRGLAIDPASGHLHTLDTARNALYEIATAGQLLAVRDLSSFSLKDPEGMVFAPSGDQTDDVSKMSLYLADGGVSDGKDGKIGSPGQIVELSLDAPAAPAASSFQSTLVRTTIMATFSPPSPDPSGLTYIPSTGTLLMSDGEVEETVGGTTHFQGANLWEMTLQGGVVSTANISTVAPTVVPMTDEPTGAAWNPNNGHFYFTDDDARKVYDLNPGADKLPGTADDSWTSFDTSAAGCGDPEGITYDSLHNRIFIVDGTNIEVYEYTTSGALVNHFDVQAYGVTDPEGVEFNPYSGTLYVLSSAASPIIIETTTSGALLRTIDVSADNARAPAGLAYAPASDNSGVRDFYIVDRGIDNNTNPTIIDGKMYEMTAPSYTPDNLPPTADAGTDQMITISQVASLQGSAHDNDTIPTGQVTVTWSKISGPGTVTFSDANVVNPTATFSSIGIYVLRLIADDGELVASDDMTITVTGNNGELLIEVRVAASSDDAEESASGGVALNSSDLELVYDGSNQKVGMRFNGVDIPQAATVTSAYVQFKVDETNSESTALTVQAQAADQADGFTTAANNVSSRDRTTAAVAWNPNPWLTVGAAGADQRTPDIAPVIQEIVDRARWASGNSLAIIITGTGHRTAEAYDGDTVGAPLLHVEYRPPSSNHAPIANPQSVTTEEDTAKSITLTATDQDGDALTYTVVTPPTHGTLSGTGPTQTYTPAANYNGSDSFTFKASDGKADSTAATVTITVNAVNDPPVANSLSVTTAEDTAKSFTLTASDVEGSTLAYIIVSGPGHGTLTGTAPNLSYTPAANYNGSDSFTFKVNDGTVDSTTATASITVTPVNDPPVANSQSVTTAQKTAVTITLTGTDVDGDTLSYSILAGPTHGTLSGTGSTRTYTPAADYNGADSFTFNVNDGTATSPAATVSITITAAANHPPVANAQSVTTEEDTLKSITLTATDQDGDALTYTVVTPPPHGTLSGTGPTQTYTPAANYNGSDNFTFKASDGKADSNVATVTITINAVNDPPVATPQSVTTAEDTAKSITLTGSDVEGNPLTYTIVSGPGHGTLTGIAPNLTYKPAADYNGSDNFAFKVNDGAIDSAPATVSITVTPVNDPPVANAQSATTPEDTAKSLTLTGSDVEGSPLTYTIVSGPGHGALTGIAPNVTYTPAPSYSGPDSFNFKVNDGTVDSTPATVSITVTAVNHPPMANAQGVTTDEDTPRGITLTGSDVDGNTLTYSVVTPPAHGSLTGTAPNLTYAPASNYNGSDSFTFKVNDGTVDSAPATVSITVTPVNDPPVANPQSATTAQNTPVVIALTGSDVDGNTLTYTIVTAPANGTLSGTAPNLTYNPAAGYSGPDSFTFQVNDGTLNSNIATVTIAVQPPVNKAPVVDAGPDKTVVYPNSVTLSASVRDDGLPAPPALSYTWSKVSGPGTVTPNNVKGTTTSGAIFNTTFTFSKTGSYTLRLTGTDGLLLSTDDVVVSVRKK